MPVLFVSITSRGRPFRAASGVLPNGVLCELASVRQNPLNPKGAEGQAESSFQVIADATVRFPRIPQLPHPLQRFLLFDVLNQEPVLLHRVPERHATRDVLSERAPVRMDFQRPFTNPFFF